MRCWPGWWNIVVLPGADAVDLTETDQFRDTLAALPEDAYNIVVYTDFTGLVDIAAMALPMMIDPALLPDIEYRKPQRTARPAGYRFHRA